MIREGKRRLTSHSSPPRPVQDHIAADPSAHPTITHAGECRARRWSHTLITPRPLGPHPSSGRRFIVGASGKQRKVVQTLPSHVMGNVSPFPTGKCAGHGF